MLNICYPFFPDEITRKFFSCLSLTELAKAGSVCKHWYSVSKENELWFPFYKELNPFEKNIIFEKNKLKEIIIIDLQEHVNEADRIVNFINDYAIAAMFCSSISLNKLKKMPLECCFHVMSTARNNCAKLYLKITEVFEISLKGKESVSNYDASPLDLLDHLFKACHDDNYRKDPEYKNSLYKNFLKAHHCQEVFIRLKNAHSLGEGTYFD
ncbi:MAG: F-box protein [Candidatus Protochlamydia sp.]|nr:F-box protein [Candidatus Protochlamydia sp.]